MSLLEEFPPHKTRDLVLALMTHLDCSGNELARRVGVSQSTISRIINAKYTPRVSTYYALLDFARRAFHPEAR